MNAEITSLLDQDVYTQKGIFVGRVDDAVLDPENGVVSGLALGDVEPGALRSEGQGDRHTLPLGYGCRRYHHHQALDQKCKG